MRRFFISRFTSYLAVCAATFGLGMLATFARTIQILPDQDVIEPLLVPEKMKARLITVEFVTRTSPIRTIDFRNFSYPEIWLKGRFTLSDGKFEIEREHCHTRYTLEAVFYSDFNEDGREDALVNVTDYTACGSSGLNDYYYLYEIEDNVPTLLWHFSTGSEGLCGQKYFRVDDKQIVLELYGDCRIKGTKFEGGGPECCPTEYSRIRAGWRGRRFGTFAAETIPYMSK